MAWTDERLDDLADRMDAGFARTERELRDLRREAFGSRTDLHGAMGALRTEVKADIDALRTEVKADIGELRTITLRFGVAIVTCLVGVIATLIGVVATGSISG